MKVREKQPVRLKENLNLEISGAVSAACGFVVKEESFADLDQFISEVAGGIVQTLRKVNK